MTPLRLAVIGAGRMSEVIHLPIAANYPGVDVVAIVERDQARAKKLADLHGVPRVERDYRAVLGHVDAAVVALPNCLHAPVAGELLQNGIGVLLEKPMALTVSDCDDLIAAAHATGAKLAIGLHNRFTDHGSLVKSVIDGNVLGSRLQVSLSQGGVFGWRVNSDAIFRKDLSGGGVLMDMGPHILDLVHWWFGEVDQIRYLDDSFGGVEAECIIDMVMRSGTSVHVELSRLRDRPNSWSIKGENGVLDVAFDFDPQVTLTLGEAGVGLTGWARAKREPAQPRSKPALVVFRRQFANFLKSIRESTEPTVGGSEGRLNVQLIEQCYRARQPLHYPWDRDQTRDCGREMEVFA